MILAYFLRIRKSKVQVLVPDRKRHTGPTQFRPRHRQIGSARNVSERKVNSDTFNSSSSLSKQKKKKEKRGTHANINLFHIPRNEFFEPQEFGSLRQHFQIIHYFLVVLRVFVYMTMKKQRRGGYEDRYFCLFVFQALTTENITRVDAESCVRDRIFYIFQIP